ncbi:EamA family transporter RarD [Aestuariibius sp. HNIBRBA575]|uniref:EamA family transporter RarD n=1 Tax=Aestuariibius sp. HNIBRBA575 TaxID=3233343 RepID=UPI0034A31404
MNEPIKGIAAMGLACVIWGLSPLFYALLKHMPPMDILAHRTVWSLVFFLIVLLLQRRVRALFSALKPGRSLWMIAAASILISVNWFGFIYSIQVGRALEASLGYYIFPLAAVALGRLVLGELLSFFQWVAVGIAVLAVIVLTVGLGVAPWIALHLAITFGLYGLLKKQLEIGPMVSVAAEVALLLPLAVFWLLGWGQSGGVDPTTFGLLVLSGPLTGGPLMLMSFAAKRVRLSTIGVVQYLNPTLQFACAAIVFAETITRWHMIAFPMIWLALAIYSGATVIQDRRNRA